MFACIFASYLFIYKHKYLEIQVKIEIDTFHLTLNIACTSYVYPYVVILKPNSTCNSREW